MIMRRREIKAIRTALASVAQQSKGDAALQRRILSLQNDMLRERERADRLALDFQRLARDYHATKNAVLERDEIRAKLDEQIMRNEGLTRLWLQERGIPWSYGED